MSLVEEMLNRVILNFMLALFKNHSDQSEVVNTNSPYHRPDHDSSDHSIHDQPLRHLK